MSQESRGFIPGRVNDPRPGDATVILPVPGDFQAPLDAELSVAIRWREVTRGAFLHYLSRGYEVRELVRGTPGSAYVLVKRV